MVSAHHSSSLRICISIILDGVSRAESSTSLHVVVAVDHGISLTAEDTPKNVSTKNQKN
jgi:hypothetical protein